MRKLVSSECLRFLGYEIPYNFKGDFAGNRPPRDKINAEVG
jgi:hypothetical protein